MSMLFRDIDCNDCEADPWRDVQEYWNREASSALYFIEEQLQVRHTDIIKSELYEEYKDFCMEKDLEVVGIQTFYKRCNEMGIRQVKKIDEHGDSRYWFKFKVKQVDYDDEATYLNAEERMKLGID